MKNNPLLEIDNLHVRYADGTRAVRGVKLTIQAGQCLALVGESGSGKSTIAESVLKLHPQGTETTGTIRFKGMDLLQLPEKQMRQLRGMEIGFIGQDPCAACNPVFRVQNNVAEAWRAHGLNVKPNRISTILSSMGIKGASASAKLYPHQWSGGMLQRAEIAAASAQNPSLIIADEPTSSLDADLAVGIFKLISSLNASVLLISHDLTLVSNFASSTAVCYAGSIVEIGKSDRIASQPRHPYTLALMQSIPRKGAPLPRFLRGTIANLQQTAAGCPFAPRCDYSINRCELENPTLVGGVACHLNHGRGLTELRPTASSRKPLRNRKETKVTAELKGVEKGYRYRGQYQKILSGIDLKLFPGEIVGICGPSGSGKSTLLRILAGIEPPNQGEVFHGGQIVWRRKGSKAKRRLPRTGFTMSVFQNPYSSLDQRRPIWKTILEPLKASHRKNDALTFCRESAVRLLESVNLANLTGSERPEELSIGQCQRVSILRALTAEPSLVIADEPTSSLDVTTAVGIYHLLREKADSGMAIVMVSHDENALGVLSDRLFRMSNGRLTISGR